VVLFKLGRLGIFSQRKGKSFLSGKSRRSSLTKTPVPVKSLRIRRRSDLKLLALALSTVAQSHFDYCLDYLLTSRHSMTISGRVIRSSLVDSRTEIGNVPEH